MVSPRDNFNWDQFREFMVFLANRHQAKGRPLFDLWYQCDCLGRVDELEDVVVIWTSLSRVATRR